MLISWILYHLHCQMIAYNLPDLHHRKIKLIYEETCIALFKFAVIEIWKLDSHRLADKIPLSRKFPLTEVRVNHKYGGVGRTVRRAAGALAIILIMSILLLFLHNDLQLEFQPKRL